MRHYISYQLKQHWVWLMAAAAPLVLFFSFHPHYIRDNIFFWVCLITLPLSMKSRAHGTVNWAFLLAVIVASISLILPTTVGIYIVLCLIITLLAQSIVGRSNYTLIIHILLGSPLFGYLSSLVSFPIRLYLSSIVTYLLSFINADIRIEGNLVHLENTSFLVDEACTGLSMLGYGILFGTIILSILAANKRLNFQSLLLYYTILISLILAGNIIRITLLIMFHIMPDQWMHEGLGLFLYAFQILLPFYLIVRYCFKKIPKNINNQPPNVPMFPRTQYALLVVLMMTMMVRHYSANNDSMRRESQVNLRGYQATGIKDGVIKLENDHSLIYIKPPVPAYRADHNPMICWQGSGYSFKKIENWHMKSTSINYAELVKGNDKVHTAWWFKSDRHQTGGQLEWRKYSLFNNEEFYLINVTCSTKAELKSELENLLTQKIFAHSKTNNSHEI